MFKKIILLFIVVINIIIIQNTAFSKENYTQSFYMKNLQKKIESNWFIPEKSEGKSAVISFDINKKGQISNIKILRGSKDENFDTKAIAAVLKTGSFSPLTDNKETLSIQYFFSPLFTSVMAVKNKVKQPLFYSEGRNIIAVSNRISYVNFIPYANNLAGKINSNWVPQKSKKEKTTIVKVKISKDGTLEDYKIVKFSKDKKFDKSILDAISNSVPLEALPSNFDAKSKIIHLTFKYIPKECKQSNQHFINAKVNNLNGYDEYVKQVESIISASISGKSYYHHKDIIFEMNIDETGKIKYVKIKEPTNDKNFNRKILAIMQKTHFRQSLMK